MPQQMLEDRSPAGDEETHAVSQPNPFRSPATVETARPRHKRAWIVRHVVGWSSLALGAAGLALPILPGWPFIAWGLITLAPDIPVFARLLGLVERKLPRMRPIIERVRGDAPRSQPGASD